MNKPVLDRVASAAWLEDSYDVIHKLLRDLALEHARPQKRRFPLNEERSRTAHTEVLPASGATAERTASLG
jgi:hypothetical protein